MKAILHLKLKIIFGWGIIGMGIVRFIISHQMIISFKILLLLALTLVNGRKALRFELDDQTQGSIADKWNEIQQQINNAQEVIIHFSGISQVTMNKIFSLPMPRLRILSFGNYHFDHAQPTFLLNPPHHQFLTHKLLKNILSNPSFGHVQELNLIGTNLDDNCLKVIEEIDWNNRKINIQKLLIGNNYIGRKGFRYLAMIPFTSLTQIDISGNLLIQSQSVTSIVKMIQSQQPIPSKRKLQSLDVSSTCIQGPDLVRLLQAIDTQSLLYLNISKLNLHQRNKYHEGFDLSTYQALANMTFPKLKRLQMSDLALDSTILALFEKWKFPSLEALSIHTNFIDDQSLKHWVTKENFPLLKILIIAQTDIKDEGLQYILSQKFQLRELNIGMTRLSRQGIKLLSHLDTSKLTKLFLKALNIQSEALQSFFHQNSFENLEQISLTENKQISNLFDYFPWQKLKKIRKMVLTSTYIQESLSNLFEINSTLLPNLQYLILDGTGLTAQNITRFIQLSHVLFPSLKYVNLAPQFEQPINFTRLSIQSTQKQVKFMLGYVTFQKIYDQLALKQIKSLSWIMLYSSKSNLVPYIKPLSQHFLKLTKDNEDIKQFPKDMLKPLVEQIKKLFSFEKLELLVISTILEWQVFAELLKQTNLTEFKHMNKLYIDVPIQSSILASFLGMLSLPILQDLRITINITKPKQKFDHLAKALKVHNHLTHFTIRFIYPSSFSRQKDYNSFLNQLRFPFLIYLDLSENHLETEEIGGILYNHASTLRFLNVRNNFLQKSFLKMVSSYEMSLRTIDISFISFTPTEFKQLGNANFGFLADFKAQNCGLTDDHIIQFIQVSSNSTFKKSLFPKLGLLSLNQNEIREKGVRLFFQQSLYNLITIRIKRNYNPHFLNILLTYSSKINELVVNDVEIYALDKNIQPISTRRIAIFAIQTYSFTQSDYDILGSLNFNRLQISQIQTRHFYECENLNHLLSISSNARVIWISFGGEQQRLGSECLDRVNKYKDFEAQVEELAIYESTYQSYIPDFVQLFLTSKKKWKQLLFQRLKLPPSIFMKINPKQLQHLRTLYIGQNHIDDGGFARMLQSPLQNLQFMRIADTDITMKSLTLLSNRTFSSLEHIDLSGLPLGEEGVQMLTTLQAKRLKVLIIQRCDIRSLQKFHQMKFPLVYQLLISYNYLTVREIINFLTHLNRQTWPNLWKIAANGISPTEAQKKQISKLALQVRVDIQFDQPHHLEFINNAKY